jgi:hypothetical protein
MLSGAIRWFLIAILVPAAGVRKIAEQFGFNPGKVQRISRPFEGSAAA